MTNPSVLRIDERDHVLVALRPLEAGATVEGVTVLAPIPAGHKIAAHLVGDGQEVFKYGHPIGRATRTIVPGEHVHVHNLASALDDVVRDRPFVTPTLRPVPRGTRPATFAGYLRPNGRVGVRNEIWIVPTVACVGRTARRIADATQHLVGDGLEGVLALEHPLGCSQTGDDLARVQRALAGLANQSNAGGVLVLGLGCENNRLKSQLEAMGPIDPERVVFFDAQDVDDEAAEGIRCVTGLAERLRAMKRGPVDARELVLGMKCGGSDGLSGVTANPLVGRIADRLAALGGTSILTEVPEMFGAEPVLLARAASKAVFDRTIALVNDFRSYLRRHGLPLDENPSPGNRDGGITTLAEKALGCVQKVGTAPIAEVLAYGSAASSHLGGVALLDAPGNDPVSTTALVAAGAHMVLFTTGRGTPMGSPVPTLKISSNSDLARRKPSWIDFDAGRLDSPADLTQDLFSLVLDVASGCRRCNNEIHDQREIALWNDGATL